MAKKIPLLLFFILSLSLSSALELSLEKPLFNQGETLIARLNGNILEPINSNDVSFLLGHETKPFNHKVFKIQDSYYIYAITPYSENNYTLRINDVYFKQNNEFKTEDIEINFSTSYNVADFYAMPSSLITQENISVDIYNNLDFSINVNYYLEELNETISKTIKTQSSTKVIIETEDIDYTTLTSLIMESGNTTYVFPLEIIKDKEGTNNLVRIDRSEDGAKLRFSLTKMEESLNAGQTYEYKIMLKNEGLESSGEISLEVAGNIQDLIELPEIIIPELNAGEEAEIIFTISPKIVGEFNGFIIADSIDSTDSIEIVTIVGENIEVGSSVRNNNKLTCEELKGKVCSVCEGSQVPSADGIFCCMGECANSNSESGVNYWAITIIVILFLALIGLVLWRLKTSGKLPNPLKARINAI